MPPRRARASSVSSTGTSSNPRRSSRKSITVLPPPPPAPSSKPSAAKKPSSKKVVKKGRRTSKIQEESEEEEDELSESESESDEDGEESTTKTGGKKRKASSSTTKSKMTVTTPKEKKEKPAKKEKPLRTIKPKPRRTAISGLNPLPELFTPFPLYSVFTGFEIPQLPSPSEAPRSVFVFGTGDMGQHGLGTSTLDEIKRPRRHVNIEEFIETGKEGWQGGVGELVCGGMHTLAIDQNGKVWSWGINDNAALGRQTSKPDIEAEELESNLYPVEGLTGPNEEEFKAVRVAAGDSVSLAVSREGEVKAWGSFRSAEGLLGFDGSADSSKTQLHPTSLKNLEKHTIVQIACGDDHFLALTSTGHVFACGNGEQNQLGRKIVQRHKTHGLTPERLALKNIVLVGSGSYHSFAVSESGTVYAWGLNSYHQTAVSDEDGGYADVISTPTVVSAFDPSDHDGARVVQISAGAHHSLFLLSNGQVWAVGRTDGHEVGVADGHEEMKANEERKEEARKERKEREQVELDKRIDRETGQVKETTTDEDGEVLSKEDAEFQAKEAAAKAVPLPNDYVLNPTRLVFPKEPKENDPSFKADDFDEDTETEETKIVSIAAGTRHNFAVSSRGYVYSWGVGASSQLGQGNEEEIETPTRIWNTALSNVRVIKAETGGQHSVIVGVDREWEDKYEKRKEAKKERESAKAVEEQQKASVEKENGDDKMEVDGREEAEEKKDDRDKAEEVKENGAATETTSAGDEEKKSE